jgi:1-phosphofructokinase family hexose kinase
MILTVTLNPAVDYTVFGRNFTVGTTNRGDDIPPDPGGKGINSARVARLLGCEVMTTGFVGGHTGAFLQERLRAEGIVTAFQPIASPTRITVAFIDRGNGDQTKVVPDGPMITSEDTRDFCRHLENLVAANRFSMVSMNGSVGRGMDPSIYRRLTSICAAHGIPVFLDTSGEALAAVEGEPPGNAGAGVSVAMPKAAPGLFIIKPNLEEARDLCRVAAGEGLSAILEGLRTKLSVVPCIALTLGAEGAILLTRETCLQGRIPAVSAVNPVCAGDAFVGGFLAAYDRDARDLVHCFRSAIAAGTATASVKALLWAPPLFEELLTRVEIRDRR